MNFQYDSETCLSVLLCGQEELLARNDIDESCLQYGTLRMKLSILEPLANSVTTTVVVRGLSPEETASYIEERLRQAGAQPDVFSPQAIRAIHNASHGIMRSINALAGGALVKAWRVKAKKIESELVTSLFTES